MRQETAIVLLCRPEWTDEVFVEGVFDTTTAAEDFVLNIEQDFKRRGYTVDHTLVNGKVHRFEIGNGKAWEFEYVITKHYIGSSMYWDN